MFTWEVRWPRIRPALFVFWHAIVPVTLVLAFERAEARGSRIACSIALAISVLPAGARFAEWLNDKQSGKGPTGQD